MHLRTLLKPDAKTLRSLLERIEQYDPVEDEACAHAEQLNKAIDFAFYGPQSRSCSACGSSAIYFASQYVGNLDNALDIITTTGWRFEAMQVGRGCASATVSKDGIETEGIGKHHNTALLSALLRAHLKQVT